MSRSAGAFSVTPRGPAALGRALAAGLALFLAATSAGAAQTAARPVISRIMVEVDGRPAGPELAALVALREGDPFSLKAVDQALRQIFQSAEYSDVQVQRSGEERVELTFLLTRRLTIRSIRIVAGAELPQRRLREGLADATVGGVYIPERLPLAVEELKLRLRDEGYFEAAVEGRAERDATEPAVDLTFEVAGWRRLTVGSLRFEGTPVLGEDELGRRLKVRKGEAYVPAGFKQALDELKAYYISLGYQRAEVLLAGEKLDPETGLASLVVRADAREKITIRITGAPIPTSLIAPIWEERVFEEWALSEGQLRILGRLWAENYLFARVSPRLEKAENEIRVIYEVEPGAKERIRELRFEGLTAFTPERVKAELGVGERVLFFPFLNGEQLFEMPREVEAFLNSQGFPSPRVDLRLDKEDRGVTAVLVIEEGPQQTVDRVLLEGIKLVPEAELLGVLESRPGGPYFAPNVQRDIERATTFYLDRGVRATQITSEVRPARENVFTLVYRIREGELLHIGQVVVAGNRVTRTPTVRREIQLRSGDVASAERIQESKQRLERLGIFSSVTIDEIPAGPGLENLVVSVRESERNYAALGVGLETRNDVRAQALWSNALRPRGTAEFIRSNIFGMAAQVSLVTQFSLIEKRLVAVWDQPYFFSIPMRTQASAWLEAEDRTSFGFERRGASFNLIKSLSHGPRLLLTLSWSRTKLTFLKIAESEVDRRLFPYSTSLVSTSVIWDHRDDSINPERGVFLSGVFEWAYPLFATESNFQKTFWKLQVFRPLLPRLNFSFTARAGLGRGRMPIPERFFAGGSNSFRGEEFDRLGPNDPESDMPVGGKAIFLLNMELTFPVIASLRDLSAAFFYDLGNVFAQRADFSLFSLRGALGGGLRYRTPLGPVRLEVGWNLDDPARRGRPIVFITIGNVF